ncbi:ATP-dependent helicase, partial [Streptomyces sp. NPDC006464]
TQVRSGDEALTRITGAQTPSGIPITITTPAAEQRKRSASSRGRRGPAAAARRGNVRRTAVGTAA